MSRKSDWCKRCRAPMWTVAGRTKGSGVCHPCRRIEPEPSGDRVAYDPNCIRCGQPKPYGRRKLKTCSDECFVELRRSFIRAESRGVTQCEQCGAEFPTTTSKTTVDGVPTRTPKRFCGRPCADAHRAANKVVKYESCPVHFIECRHCGIVFAARSRLSKVCGASCRRARMNEASRRALRRKPKTVVFYVRGCIDCGELQWTPYAKLLRCRPCRRKRDNKRKGSDSHIERARRFGVKYERFDPMDIYERDGWRCHLCSKRIKRKPGSHQEPNGWSIDHVVPMSLGGPHLRSNVAAAHWRCNVVKGARALGEQMALIG